MSILNLTPHDIKIMDENGNVLVNYPASKKQLRMISESQKKVKCGLASEIPVVTAQQWSGIDENVEIDPGVNYLLVSMPVGNFLANSSISNKYWNYTILGPDTGPEGAVRDENNQIIGCRRLVLYTYARYKELEC